MKNFTKALQIRWSDLDPNFHLRHSVYYDWGAYCRFAFMEHASLTGEVLHRLQIEPILFREECIFRKEVLFGDEMILNLQLLKAKKNFSRWTIQHYIKGNSKNSKKV